ncbi:MAG: AAA family ATPase [Pseudomonadota bacterium]
MYIKRKYWIESLEKISKSFRLICISGPRQIGKSTFLRDCGNYFSFDDPNLRNAIKEDPVFWLKNEFKKDKRIILDEATRVPEIFEAMKIVADENPKINGKIWFASSSNYLLSKRIKESLAGRVFNFKCSQFLLSEISGCENPSFIKWLKNEEISENFFDKDRIIESSLKYSLFPDPYISKDEDFSKMWLNQYLATYVLQDIVEGFSKIDISKWQEFMHTFVSYPASIMPLNSLSNILGIHHNTVAEYIKIANASLLTINLPVYSKSAIKRLTKGPKYIITDSTLCKSLNNETEKGLLFENLIISQIINLLNARLISHKAYHYRTADHAEVDLVLETDFGIFPIEIKSAKNITNKMSSGIKSFFEAHPKVKRGAIFYNGSKVSKISNIDILPVSMLFM